MVAAKTQQQALAEAQDTSEATDPQMRQQQHPTQELRATPAQDRATELPIAQVYRELHEDATQELEVEDHYRRRPRKGYPHCG